MKPINYYKQLDSIVCEEINVKVLARAVADTERGILELLYLNKENIYKLKLDGVLLDQEPSEKLVLMILSNENN